MPYLNDQRRIQIFFGGSSSGKSVFLSQRCVIDILKGSRNYLVVRNVSKTLRSSVFAEIRKVINQWDLGKLFRINISDMTITCKNGYQILFKGLDDVQKLKSITVEKDVITDIWIEETTEISIEDFKELRKRLRGKAHGIKKRIHMSFNPIMRIHWLFKAFFKGWQDNSNIFEKEGLLIRKTIYKDNRFLEPDDIKELEDETDEYYYQVYSLGNWGVLGAIIFKNWQVEDLSEQIPHFDNIRNGLDFGFSNHPTTFNRCHYDKTRKRIYIFNEFHEIGLTNPEIADMLKPIIGDEDIFCDSAEPKSIQELKNNGINAYGAVKGKDSVKHGIQWLQQQEIIIHKDCQHTINEFQLYQWKKNKDGEVTNTPVDRDNHHIDDIRYALESDMVEEEQIVIEIGEYQF